MSTEKSLGQVAYDCIVGEGEWHKESPKHKEQWEAAASACLGSYFNDPRGDYRTMRSLLLRIHSARVAMNEAAVIAALDDVDALFREENTN